MGMFYQCLPATVSTQKFAWSPHWSESEKDPRWPDPIKTNVQEWKEDETPEIQGAKSTQSSGAGDVSKTDRIMIDLDLIRSANLPTLSSSTPRTEGFCLLEGSGGNPADARNFPMDRDVAQCRRGSYRRQTCGIASTSRLPSPGRKLVDFIPKIRRLGSTERQPGQFVDSGILT